MRIALILIAALLAGTFVGVLIAGVFLAFSLGHDLNNMDMLLFLDYLPNRYRWGRSPYAQAYIIVAAAPALALIIAVFTLTRAKLAVYGDAHFQSKREMRQNGMLEPMGAGLLFGRYTKRPHHPKGKPIQIRDDRYSRDWYVPRFVKSTQAARRRKSPPPFISATYDKFPHALVVAPTGAGKTVGYVIPTTIVFPGSMVILDVKGEIFEKTSRLRQGYGDKVMRFAPFDFKNPTHQYNPLHRIAQFGEREQQFTELQKIGALFLQVEGGNAHDFVSGGIELFVAAGILAIERGNATFGEIYRVIYGEGLELEDDDNAIGATTRLLAAAKEVGYQPARQIFAEYAGLDPRIRDSYLSVLKASGLRQWSNPRVERITRRNEIDFSTIRRELQTIYLCVNSDDIPALDSLIRLFFSELIQFLRQNEPGDDEIHPVQIMLDEFDQLGHMPIVVKALKQIRSHGARVSIITQSIPGLRTIYTEDERESIEANAGVKLYITANDHSTADEIERSLGMRTGIAVSRSQEIGAVGPAAGSVTRHAEDRPLLTAQQIRRLDNSKVIILPERQHPILADRIEYYKDPVLAPYYDSQKGPLPYRDADLAKVMEQQEEEVLRSAQAERAARLAQSANQGEEDGEEAQDAAPEDPKAGDKKPKTKKAKKKARKKKKQARKKIARGTFAKTEREAKKKASGEGHLDEAQREDLHSVVGPMQEVANEIAPEEEAPQ